MFALINTWNALTPDSIGTVLSVHRTSRAAAAADAAFCRRVWRLYGSGSFIPTAIVSLSGSGRGLVGRHIARREWVGFVPPEELV